MAVKRKGSDNTSYKQVKKVTQAEIQQVVGLILYMGIHKLPQRRMYWANTTFVPLVANCMPRNRFEEICLFFILIITKKPLLMHLIPIMINYIK